MINVMHLCGAAWRGVPEGQRSKVNVKSKYHHHVVHVGHFLHVPHVGHLSQRYCFLSTLYNSGLMRLERRKVKGYKLVCLF